jgi:diguanylate cyclase (GGDEF)-like protein/PAS domain S-box-containing protein
MDEQTATIPSSLLQLHFDSSVDGQYVLDTEVDVFVKVNPAMCHLLGFTREQLVEARRPVSMMSLVHEGDRELVESHRLTMVNPGDSGVMRYRIVRSDGALRHLEVRYTLVNFMGRLLQVGSARDVSDQVRLESKLRYESEFNRELTFAAQRSAQEAQRQSQEALEANKRVNALADVLRAIPVLTKRLVEIPDLDAVFRETTLTMVSDAQFSHCAVIMHAEKGELDVRHSNPEGLDAPQLLAAAPGFLPVVAGSAEIAADDAGNHLAAIRSGSALRGLLYAGIPESLQPFYREHQKVQQSLKDLVSTIADFLGVVISNHENLEAIKQQNRLDRVTGLLNRRVFEEQLSIEFRRAIRYERDLSLLMLDIDDFKRVNDTYGHQQGDRVLEMMGELIAGCFRDLDAVCRYGGEEICVIMPETPGPAARSKAEQVRRAIAGLRVPMIEQSGRTLNITVSIGIACITPNTSTEEQLLREADKALYFCKNNGKNQVKLLMEQ